MKSIRHILHFTFLLLVVTAHAQVGIGNEAPRGLLDVNDNPDGNASAGLVLPHAANVTTLQNPAESNATSTIPGTMAFDSGMDCIRFIKNDNTWSGCISILQPGTVGPLDCSGATNNGTLISGTVVTGNDVNSVISYTGGNGGAHSRQTIQSRDLVGLTATLTVGNFATGDGTLTYTITGRPLTAGTATFVISIGGQTCNLTRTVAAATTGSFPRNITLTAGQVAYIPSVFDRDYLPYTDPTTVAATGSTAASGGMEENTVNFQGRLTTQGITVQIPYTVTSATVNLPAFSQRRTVPSTLVQGSDPNSTQGGGGAVEVEISYSATSLAVGSGTIAATIRTVSGTLNAVKLDLNRGIGTDLGVLMAQFTIMTNSSGGTGNIELKVTPGILDRNFTDANHKFIYFPIVVAEDGEIWLSNDLGANYSNINNSAFNPTQQATAANDFNASGNLFQWGRRADGHELINRTGSTSAVAVNGTTATRSDNPSNSLFILTTEPGPDGEGVAASTWRVSANNADLWNGENAVNNPCPAGFRVPTETEWTTYGTALGGSNTFSSNLRLSAGGLRNTDGRIGGFPGPAGPEAFYWTGTYSNANSMNNANFVSHIAARADIRQPIAIDNTSPIINMGHTVRCIKD